MLQAYKLNKDHQYWKQPRVFITDDSSGKPDYVWAVATPTKPTVYGISLYWLEKEGYLHKIDIYKEKWVHPHLIKKLKQDLEIQK